MTNQKPYILLIILLTTISIILLINNNQQKQTHQEIMAQLYQYDVTLRQSQTNHKIEQTEHLNTKSKLTELNQIQLKFIEQYTFTTTENVEINRIILKTTNTPNDNNPNNLDIYYHFDYFTDDYTPFVTYNYTYYQNENQLLITTAEGLIISND